MKIYNFFFFVLVLLSISQHCQATDSQPNILFIVCDDLNTLVSTSDYPYISTPAFDALADNGMTFERAYCQYPVCGLKSNTNPIEAAPQLVCVTHVQSTRNLTTGSRWLKGLF